MKLTTKAQSVANPEVKQRNLDTNDKQDVYTRVTNKIISDLEKGNLTWLRPWKSKDFGGCVSLPLRSDGQPYQGINVLNLWGAAVDKGYTRPVWMTFKKAKELGGQVKKGEKGTTVVYASSFEKLEVNDEGEETTWGISHINAKKYIFVLCEGYGGRDAWKMAVFRG